MTEPTSPEQAGTGRPRFDPARSAAIRSLLIETVEAEGRGAAATATTAATSSPHRRRRTAVIVALAVLAGGIASGTAAIALTGGSLFGPPEPVVTTVAPTPTPTPTPTLTPTPTPTPTAAPNPPAPVVRVPATCDQLLPQSTAESIVGASLVLAPESQFGNPLFYTNQRVGSLGCAWSSTDTEDYLRYGMSVSIVPGVAEEDYTYSIGGEAWAGSKAETELSPNAMGWCDPQTEPNAAASCSLTAFVPGYAVYVRSSVQYGSAMTDEQRSETKSFFADVLTTMGGFPPPAPLWQPTGGTIAGATDCDGLIDPATLDSILGAEMTEFKSEGGEYSNSSYRSNLQVNATWCSWTDYDSDSGAHAFAAVLPGGASYFAGSSAAEPDKGWAPTTDYPGEAYITADGGTVTVLIKGAWIEVQAPADVLHAVTDVVLANVGATP